MAKFLQETISESGLRAEKVVNSDEFKEFFRKVRPSSPVVRSNIGSRPADPRVSLFSLFLSLELEPLADRSDPPEKRLPRRTSSAWPSSSRMTSPWTTCPALSLSACAGT